MNEKIDALNMNCSKDPFMSRSTLVVHSLIEPIITSSDANCYRSIMERIPEVTQ